MGGGGCYPRISICNFQHLQVIKKQFTKVHQRSRTPKTKFVLTKCRIFFLFLQRLNSGIKIKQYQCFSTAQKVYYTSKKKSVKELCHNECAWSFYPFSVLFLNLSPNFCELFFSLYSHLSVIVSFFSLLFYLFLCNGYSLLLFFVSCMPKLIFTFSLTTDCGACRFSCFLCY